MAAVSDRGRNPSFFLQCTHSLVCFVLQALCCENAPVPDLGPTIFKVKKHGFITASSELRKVLFLALSVTCFVYEISRESLNGFVPNSHGRRVWSFAQTSLNVKVKDQDYQ